MAGAVAVAPCSAGWMRLAEPPAPQAVWDGRCGHGGGVDWGVCFAAYLWCAGRRCDGAHPAQPLARKLARSRLPAKDQYKATGRPQKRLQNVCATFTKALCQIVRMPCGAGWMRLAEPTAPQAAWDGRCGHGGICIGLLAKPQQPSGNKMAGFAPRLAAVFKKIPSLPDHFHHVCRKAYRPTHIGKPAQII